MALKTLPVQRVELCFRITTHNKCVNRITFKDGEYVYLAEEVSDSLPDNPFSMFHEKQLATFDIANKGLAGRLDWIRFVSNGVGESPVTGLTNGNPGVAVATNRDKLIVAQVAFKAAIDLVAATGGSKDDVLPMATEFARNIYQIASEL